MEDCVKTSGQSQPYFSTVRADIIHYATLWLHSTQWELHGGDSTHESNVMSPCWTSCGRMTKWSFVIHFSSRGKLQSNADIAKYIPDKLRPALIQVFGQNTKERHLKMNSIITLETTRTTIKLHNECWPHRPCKNIISMCDNSWRKALIKTWTLLFIRMYQQTEANFLPRRSHTSIGITIVQFRMTKADAFKEQDFPCTRWDSSTVNWLRRIGWLYAIGRIQWGGKWWEL